MASLLRIKLHLRAGGGHGRRAGCDRVGFNKLELQGELLTLEKLVAENGWAKQMP